MAWLDARYDRDAVLIVRVTAANLHGTAESVFSAIEEASGCCYLYVTASGVPETIVEAHATIGSRVRGNPRTSARADYSAWINSGDSAALRFTRGERRQFSGFPQHLVHLGGVQFFRMNHLPSELLQSDEATLHHS